MTRIVYVSGRYRRYRDAQVHVEDRGFQFGDAVYEVIEVYRGTLVDEARHIERLYWSLAQLHIEPPTSRPVLSQILKRVVAKNRVRDGIVYLQCSRGQATRDFFIPQAPMQPTLVVLARPQSMSDRLAKASKGIAVVTRPDPRWARCDIKTVMLLPASLAKTEAKRNHGATEVWFLDEAGYVTEGGSSTAWIVDCNSNLQTRDLSRRLLPGVTRTTLFDVADHLGLTVIERAFTPDDARRANEAFNTAASSIITPVVRIDGTDVADGRPGPVVRQLLAAFHDLALRAGHHEMRLPPQIA